MDDRLLNYLNDRHGQMFSLLQELVCINSGSHNKAGVDAVGRVVAEALGACGPTVSQIAESHVGDQLVARSPCAPERGGQMLLVGHMDTVFAPNSDFQDYREDGMHAYGPGVIDMKGGLVAGIFALKALAAAGMLQRIPIVFVANSDEEIGSRRSKAVIRAEAEKSACAFVLEAGGANGEVVTARKGNLSARLAVSGRAGHAAFAGAGKSSAILELAHKTLAIEALNDPARGISANVGTVAGGIGPNTVAAHAEARLDLRFSRPEDEEGLKDRLVQIVDETVVNGTAASLEIISGRPPMPANEANLGLYAHVKKVAGRLGIAIDSEFRPGVSDANFIAQTGTPVIDGMGPTGGRDHSPDEFLLKSSLPKRALLVAWVLADFAGQNLLTIR
jgi:glutamate carboxypeptidase